MKLVTAVAAGVPSLFHYQPFDVDRLRPILREGTLYFSNPADFNDPWDCQPWFNTTRLSEPAVIEKHVQYYIRITRAHRPDVPEDEIQRRAAILRTDHGFHRTRIEECSAAMSAAIRNEYRVYCLTPHGSSELMWAHYTNKHRGICLEFSTRNPMFCQALQVSYSVDYPMLDLTATDDPDVLAPLLYKSAVWSYENEYRLVAQEQATSTGHDTLIAKNNLVQMPRGSLTSIIVGCLAPDSTVAELKAVMNQCGVSVPLKRAIRAADQYKLQLEVIA